MACKIGDIEQCQRLLASGADINALDKAGYSPFMDAIRMGRYIIEYELISNFQLLYPIYGFKDLRCVKNLVKFVVLIFV